MSAHNPQDLKQMQSLPLEAKIRMTQRRIRDWYDYWDGQVYVSFSGGKDSTVLKHLVENAPGVYDVPSVFVNTGLEYPEIQRFAREQPNVTVVRPEMRFDQVIKKYGYPVITKRISNSIYYAKKNIAEGKETFRTKALNGYLERKNGGASFFNCGKWKFIVDAPFDVADHCCAVMKKNPLKKYSKQTGRMPITAQMASESVQRRAQWVQHGCNAYDKKQPISNPMSFWTEQDVLHYLKKYDVPYCSVYGDIVTEDADGNQYDIHPEHLEFLFSAGSIPELETTGCDRTGCIFCMFGCHLEGEPNRFQRLKETHPRQYEYCIGGGAYVWKGFVKSSSRWKEFDFINDDGSEMTTDEINAFIEEHKQNKNFKFEKVWQPNKEGLGLGKVLDYIGVKYD